MYLRALQWYLEGIVMKSNMGYILTEIKDMSKGEAIAIGVEGLLVDSTITHGEMISAMSSVITKPLKSGLECDRPT